MADSRVSAISHARGIRSNAPSRTLPGGWYVVVLYRRTFVAVPPPSNFESIKSALKPALKPACFTTLPRRRLDATVQGVKSHETSDHMVYCGWSVACRCGRLGDRATRAQRGPGLHRARQAGERRTGQTETGV